MNRNQNLKMKLRKPNIASFPSVSPFILSELMWRIVEERMAVIGGGCDNNYGKSIDNSVDVGYDNCDGGDLREWPVLMSIVAIVLTLVHHMTALSSMRIINENGVDVNCWCIF